MKVAFVAGKYRGKSPSDIFQHIQEARIVANNLWRMGYFAFCPHLNTAFFDGSIHADDDSIWLEGALEFLRRSDLIVMVSGWETSAGARKELSLAQELGKPIFYYPRDIENLKGFVDMRLEQGQDWLCEKHSY